MNTLRKLQQEFLGYLLDDSAVSIVERIESSPKHSAEQRMTYYGNAYNMRLKEALSTDYERLHSYLGDDLFETLMQHYIESYPSHHPSLRYFIGDVRDRDRLRRAMNGVDLVVHSAALKQVPVCLQVRNFCMHDILKMLRFMARGAC